MSFYGLDPLSDRPTNQYIHNFFFFGGSGVKSKTRSTVQWIQLGNLILRFTNNRHQIPKMKYPIITYCFFFNTISFVCANIYGTIFINHENEKTRYEFVTMTHWSAWINREKMLANKVKSSKKKKNARPKDSEIK